jgi:hypothetical protein
MQTCLPSEIAPAAASASTVGTPVAATILPGPETAEKGG